MATAPKKETAAKAAKSEEKKAPAKAAAKPAAKPAASKTKAAGARKTKLSITPDGRFYATGRRKNAVARVWVARGNGKIIVNQKEVSEYFARPVLRMVINQPLAAVNGIGQFDILCTVQGGGLSGQAGALRLGISRALDQYDAAYHSTLRKGGYLTRDARVVERKKYGKAKARRSFQFSKR